MKKILAEILFYLHLIIFILFPVGFLIPSSLWPERIEYHFWFSLSLFVLFYVWGLPWTIKYRNKIHAICLLDTLTQKLRGHSLWSPENYEHSFVEELVHRFNLIPIPKKFIPLLVPNCVILSAFLYVLKLKGIVLYWLTICLPSNSTSPAKCLPTLFLGVMIGAMDFAPN